MADDVLRIMQEEWDEWCADTGCFPDDFEWKGGNGTLSFEASRWAARIVARVSNLATPQPAHTEQDGWIKCSERMPDDGQIVAIINAGHGEIYEAATVTRSGPHFILMDGLEASNYDGGAVVTLSMEATHWMPLPAAPKPESE